MILLGQFKESEITYHDNPDAMTMMRDGKVIAHAKKEQNLFTLKLAQPGKAMAMTGPRRPIHFVSQNKRICLGYYRLAHISNVRIVRASKLVDNIDLSS